ncbi:hypothetical protein D3C87_737310 [compost metagenome]
MASVLHRISKQYLDSANTPDYDPVSWIINPDLSAVIGLLPKYWIIEGDSIRAATTEERTDIDDLEGFDGLTLDQVRRRVYDSINDFRDSKINAGVIFMGYEFDSDQRARENILGMCGALSLGVTLPANFTWRSRNNDDVPMDATELATFGTSVLTYVSTNFGVSWFHKDTIRDMATDDPLEIIRYDYAGGWPSRSLDGSTLL